MKDNKDFDSWYKKKITENDQDPPEGAWQNIADELDTNDVWNRIAVELDSPRGWSPSKAIYYALPAILLLLLSGGAYYYFNKPADITPGLAVVQNVEEPGEVVEKNQNPGKDEEVEDIEVSEKTGDIQEVEGIEAVEKPGEVQETREIQKVQEVQQGQEIEKARWIDKAGAVGTVTDEREDTGVARRRTDMAKATDLDEEETVTATEADNGPAYRKLTSGAEADALSAETEEKSLAVTTFMLPDSMPYISPVTVSLYSDSLEQFAVAETPQKFVYDKTFEFGLTGSVKNTWLLNRRTLAGLEKHTLNTTVPDFGKDIGLMFAFNFSPALSAQAEGMFLSEEGQRYKEYRNGKYVDREVDLRYYSLNVLLKYRLNKAITGQPVNGSALIAGFYGSRLNKATEIVNGKISDTRAAYHDHNYGVILGYEYNRHVLPRLILSSGLRMNYGFPNIDTSIFSTTFTGSLDLNISIRYRM